MSHNTDSIASILKIQPGLDRQDFKLSHDTIKVQLTSLLTYYGINLWPHPENL